MLKLLQTYKRIERETGCDLMTVLFVKKDIEFHIVWNRKGRKYTFAAKIDEGSLVDLRDDTVVLNRFIDEARQGYVKHLEKRNENNSSISGNDHSDD